MSKCETCNAFKPTNPKVGVCRANPPSLLVFGLEKVRVPGLNGGQVGQRPLTGTGFPEVPVDGWCRQHQASKFQFTGETSTINNTDKDQG